MSEARGKAPYCADWRQVEARLRAMLRVVPEVRYVEAEDLQRVQQGGGRKPVRFIDRRGQKGTYVQRSR